jgi:hypothetical protein
VGSTQRIVNDGQFLPMPPLGGPSIADSANARKAEKQQFRVVASNMVMGMLQMGAIQLNGDDNKAKTADFTARVSDVARFLEEGSAVSGK